MPSRQNFTIRSAKRNLANATLDGKLTATLPIEDLGVGDVVDSSTPSATAPAFAKACSAMRSSCVPPFNYARIVAESRDLR